MRDPTRRPPGSWPGDRPIRWRGVAGNLTQFVIGTVAALVQLGLIVPVLVVGGSAAGDGLGGFVRLGLTLLWGGLTLFAAWSWVFGRWRIVLAPLLTVAAVLIVSSARQA
jgi:hypothetical protein